MGLGGDGTRQIDVPAHRRNDDGGCRFGEAEGRNVSRVWESEVKTGPRMNADPEQLVDHLFRHQSAKIVATLTRVFGSRHLDLAEDVVQDALLKALQQWPFKGVPENPAAWLTLVAKNRALDLLRRDASLASKAEQLELVLPRLAFPATASDIDMDDQMALILMCCHQVMSLYYQC